MAAAGRPRLLVQVLSAPPIGGVGQLARQIAERAVDSGWRSIVAHPGTTSRVGFPGEHVALGARRGLPWSVALAALLVSSRPDVVQLHGPIAGSVGAAVARATSRAPVVYTEHFAHADRRGRSRHLRRLAARLPHLNVAISARAARSLVADAGVDPARVVTIANGVPVVPAAERGTGAVFAYVANLMERKGHHVLLRALAVLRDLPEVRVRCVGTGAEAARLASLAEGLGLSGRFELLGYDPRPWQAVGDAACYVHPALREGTPLAMLEAMMRGYPVVASSTGSVAEVIRHGESGLLVPPGDAEALAAAMARLARDVALQDRLSRAARAYALEHLRLDAVLDRYFRLYESLAERKVPSSVGVR